MANSLNSFELLSPNGANGQALSKSAKKRRNRKARAAAENGTKANKGKSIASPQPAKSQDPSSSGPTTPGTPKVLKLGNGKERKDGKKKEGFTPVQKRRENGNHKTETAPVQHVVDQVATSSSKSQGGSRETLAVVQSLLDDKTKDDAKKRLATSISDTQGSEEYGLRATEALLAASSDIKGLRGATSGLEAKAKQFLANVIGVLTTSSGGQDGSRSGSEEHRKKMGEKYERLSKVKQAASGPKLLECARVTTDWNKILGAELDGSLGEVREDPFVHVSAFVKKFKSSCAEDQGALLRVGDDASAFELPEEIVKLDAEIGALERQVIELKAKRTLMMDKHYSKQSAEKRHHLSFFDKAIHAATRVDTNLAGLRKVLDSGSTQTEATKDQARLFAQYDSTFAALTACKAIQQKELSDKIEFYLQQIAEFTRDTSCGDNESFIKRLAKMATNALTESMDICNTILDIAKRIEKYTCQLKMRTADVSQSQVKELHENVAKIQEYHRETVDKALAASDVSFSVAVEVVRVDEASVALKRALKSIKLTGRDVEPAVLEHVVSPKPKQATKTAVPKEEGKGSAEESKKEGKKVAPALVPKENAWGKRLFKSTEPVEAPEAADTAAAETKE